MDEGLFKKYSHQIQKRDTFKKEILSHIKNKTGVELEEKNITLTGKTIYIKTSSTVKQKLHQKNITKVLQEKGFILK